MLNSIPLISIIIPVYNAGKHLSKCIDSVLAQTHKNLEIILVDDGSTDTSSQICDEYAAKDTRIKVIHQRNQGVSSARNAGLKATTGQYIGFVDADDYIDSDMYSYLLNLLQSTHSDMARCGIYALKNPPSFSLPLPAPEALSHLYPQIFIWNMLFSRATIHNIRFDTSLFFAEDMQFVVNVLNKNPKIIYKSDKKYHYSYNPQSATKQTFNLKKLTYFQAADYVLQYAIKHRLGDLRKQTEGQICYHAVGFLRQIARTDDINEKIIWDLQRKVRRGIIKHLFSYHKLSNKLFAVACCINFNLAKKIYLSLQTQENL